MLIPPGNGHDFTLARNQNMIDLMPNPAVVIDLTGGRLALMVRLERYVPIVIRFIDGCVQECSTCTRPKLSCVNMDAS